VQTLGVKTEFSTPPTPFIQHFCEGWDSPAAQEAMPPAWFMGIGLL